MTKYCCNLEEVQRITIAGHIRLTGQVYGSHDFDNGSEIMTSRVIGVSNDLRVVETAECYYRLVSKKGDMDFMLDKLEAEYKEKKGAFNELYKPVNEQYIVQNVAGV